MHIQGEGITSVTWRLTILSITGGLVILILLREVLPSGISTYLPLFAGGFCAAFLNGKRGLIFGGIIALTTILIELYGLYAFIGGPHGHGSLLIKIYSFELISGVLGGWTGEYVRGWL